MGFQKLVGQLDYPMFIVTVNVNDERDGCLVGFTTQCSIHPPRFLVFLSNKNRTYRIASGGADVLAVHVVPDDRRDLAEVFGGQTADEVDKLAQTEWSPGPGGVPIVAGCPNYFVGRVLDTFEGGDHLGFLLEPVEAESAPEEEAGYQELKDIDPGHEP